MCVPGDHNPAVSLTTSPTEPLPGPFDFGINFVEIVMIFLSFGLSFFKKCIYLFVCMCVHRDQRGYWISLLELEPQVVGSAVWVLVLRIKPGSSETAPMLVTTKPSLQPHDLKTCFIPCSEGHCFEYRRIPTIPWPV